MVRYLLAVAGVVMLVSAPAFAEMGDMGGTTKKVITRTHDGFGSKKVVIKRHGDGFVSKKIIHRDRMFGSSMPEHRIVKKRVIVR
jgi:hypothetical protein